MALMAPSLIAPTATADTKEVYEYTNSSSYEILQPDLLEVVPISPPDPPNGYAQLILQAQTVSKKYWEGSAELEAAGSERFLAA